MWFKAKTAARAEPFKKPTLPRGQRLYAIGDIHGCSHLLDRLLSRIAEDAATRTIESPQILTLGDYVDRGPASAKVLERLARQDLPLPFIALRGNHEEMLLLFLEDASYLASWRRFGGLETLHSFGIDVSRMLTDADFARARDELDRALSTDVRRFLAATRTHYSAGDYFFCHAGIRPGVPLEAQREHDLLWIREEFLTNPSDHGKMIVHGHTPVDEPEIRPNRINIDTGAYLSDTLTCLVLEGADQRFITS